MFIRIDKSALLDGIAMAMRAVGFRATQPIMACLFLEVVNGGVRLTGNNLEMSIQTAVIPDNPSMEREEGKIAIDAKVFSDIVKNLPAGEIQISADQKHLVTIKSGKSEFKILGNNPDEFPASDDLKTNTMFAILNNALRDMVKGVIFAASVNATKPQLGGALIKIKDGSIEMVACDGFRIALNKRLSEDFKNENYEVIIPAKTLMEIVKMLPSGAEDTLTAHLDINKAMLEFEGGKMVSRLLEGAYIQYESMLEIEEKTNITANRADLLATIDRATLVGDKVPTKFEIDNDALFISAEGSMGSMGNMSEEVPIQHEGDNLKIAFNPRYMLDALKAITSEKVRLSFQGSVSPCIIQPVDDENCKHLVLPLRLPK